MLKKFLCFPIFCFLFLSGINAQNKSLSNIPTFIPTKNFSYNIKTTDNFIFNGSVTPTIDLIVKNNRLDPMPYKISCTIQTEDGVNYYSLTQSSTINSLDSTLLSFNFYAPNPGFYKVKLQTQDELIGEFNICYEPSKVDYKYYYDKGADFFWQLLRKKNQYKDADYKVIKLRDSRVRPRETYQVDMKFRNGESLQGFLFVPVTDVNNAIVRTKLVYGGDVDLEFERDYWENCIDFVFNVDSISRLDSTFYANTIHKFSAAVDFLSTRKETKDKKVYLVGSGLSGGLALAAAIADRRFSAVSVYNPYINDTFLDSGSNFLMPRFIKSLNIPILYGMGLQDDIAVPRTLFESYNAIRAPKEYYIYPFSGQTYQESWDVLQNNFLRKY